MSEMIRDARKLRETLMRDRYRPRYHIVAPEGVHSPFDPNGALFWNGRYHLMYIIQTEKGHCWAHISSKDLLHWRHHPLALEPGGVDTGIFSGGAFIDKNGIPTITYWGLGERAGICIATSTDPDLEVWEKSPHNPVIRQQQFGYTVLPSGEPVGVADPSQIWIHEGRYYMLTGNLLVLRKFGLEMGMEEHKGDTVYLYVSDDLIHWEYLHRFYASDRRWTAEDEDNMCPDFFPLGDRHMLLFISHNRGCQYYIGRYENHRFTPETHGRMSWVDHTFFAPESLVDDRGRRIMWAWIRDGRSKETQEKSRWSGVLSLPRHLWLGEDRTLRMAVPEEFESLRMNPRHIPYVEVPAGGEVVVKGVYGDCIELIVEMSSEADRYGVKVCRSPNGEEETAIYYDAVEQALKVDTSRASLGEGPTSTEAGPLTIAPGERLELRVFIDKSMIEVFANHRQAIVRNVYPARPDSLGVALFAEGREARASVKAWDIAPTNPW